MNSKISKRTARELVKTLYTDKIGQIEIVNNGTRNKVYVVHTLTKESDVVVRISEDQKTFGNYVKEQWCMNRAKQEGIPVPEVLEVSNHIVNFPYFVAKYNRGKVANRETNFSKLYFEMGKLLKIIHNIKTDGYGEIFNWSQNQLSRVNSWQDYLNNTFHIDESIQYFIDNDIYPKTVIDRIQYVFNDLKSFKFSPILCHNDYLEKNILINSNGSISSVLDWELAISSHPFRDLGKTWRDMIFLKRDKYVEKFFEGYGLSRNKYITYRDYMFIFDVLYDVKELKVAKKSGDIKKFNGIKEFWNMFFNNSLELLSSIENYESRETSFSL